MLIAAALFVEPGHYSLQERADEVLREEILSENVQTMIDGMFQIARGERGDLEKRIMVGLAAPQVGISKRIILVDIGVDSDRKNIGELACYVNPQIIWQSEEEEFGREGCYSVDSRVCGIVKRAKSIKIEAWDRFGNEIRDDLTGFTARIFQHEIDHLDGIRFPDRVGKDGVLQWVEVDEYSEYRNNYENWPKRCAWETWIAMKKGESY